MKSRQIKKTQKVSKLVNSHQLTSSDVVHISSIDFTYSHHVQLDTMLLSKKKYLKNYTSHHNKLNVLIIKKTFGYLTRHSVWFQ
jgi:hypothetical protein